MNESEKNGNLLCVNKIKCLRVHVQLISLLIFKNVRNKFGDLRLINVILVALRVLRNLADDVRVEAKMLKKDLIGVLTKCLEHTSADHLLLAAVQFLWKLSIFAENQPNIRVVIYLH